MISKGKVFLAIVLTCIIAGVLASFDKPKERKEAKVMTDPKQELIKRGKYLVTIADCNACHSPKIMGPNGPVPDSTRLLSGHPGDRPITKVNAEATKEFVLFAMGETAAVGPWGASYAANLTSDATGIGNWTEVQFFKAIKEGKYKGLDNTRPLLPPMPWPNYAKMTDDDLKAIFAYLKSTKPVRNIVPAASPLSELIK